MGGGGEGGKVMELYLLGIVSLLMWGGGGVGGSVKL